MISLTRSFLAALALAGLLAGPFAALADTANPTVTLASTAPDPTGDNPILFTATVSDPVSDFDAADLSVSGGQITPGSFSGSGTSYSFSVTPGDGDPVHNPQPAGEVRVWIDEHRFSNNQAASAVTRRYDPTASTTAQAAAAALTLTIDSGPAEGEVVSTTTVTFGFTASAGATTRCTFGSTFDCGSPMTLGPLGDSAYTLTIVATNAAGTASTSVVRNFSVVAATSTATTTPAGDTATTTATTTTTTTSTPAPASSSGGGGGGGSNGQVVGSGPTAPGGSGGSSVNVGSGFYNPNPMIPVYVPGPVTPVVTAPSTETSNSGTVATVPRTTARVASGTAARSIAVATPAMTPASADDSAASSSAPAPTVAQSPIDTSVLGAAAATAPAPSAAVWFWGAVILLVLAGVGWLFYRSV